MTGKGRINLLRVFRAALAVMLVVNAVFATVQFSAGHIAVLNVGAVVFLAAVLCFQTSAIRRQRALDRPRPDYAAIARMEREIYGEASEEAEIMFAHAKLQARIAAIERLGLPLCPCGGTLPQHIRSPHYLPGRDAGGRIRPATDSGPDAGTSGARHETFRGNFNHVGASGDSRVTVIGTVVCAGASGNAVIEICGTLLRDARASGAAVIRVNGKIAARGPLARTS